MVRLDALRVSDWTLIRQPLCIYIVAWSWRKGGGGVAEHKCTKEVGGMMLDEDLQLALIIMVSIGRVGTRRVVRVRG